MDRKRKLIIFAIIATITIAYINFKIQSHDMRFYFGKDDGVLVQFESIIALSAFYFLLMSKENKIRQAIVGLIIGFVLGIITYIILSLIFAFILPDTEIFGLVFHSTGCLAFMLTFQVLEKRKMNALKKQELG